jgi:hypothetical protein
MIHLLDGNNYVRRMIESDTSGQTPRTLLMNLSLTDVQTFMVWDSENGNAARRKVFEGYKSKRGPLKEDIYVGFNLVYDVLKFSRAIQIKVPGYEADDIIAALARHYAIRGQKVVIDSTDRDFLQLVAEFPTLVSTGSKPKDGVELTDIRYHKTLCGDTSDSIPGIPRFGDKSWADAPKGEIKAWLDTVVAGRSPEKFEWGAKSCQAWAAIPENQQILKSYWDIIGFLPMTQEQIAQHIEVGNGDFSAGDRYLQEHLQ